MPTNPHVQALPTRRTRFLSNAIALLLLMSMFSLGITSLRLKSATMDEEVHLLTGYAYWLGQDAHLIHNHPHPRLVNALNAFPLLFLAPRPRLPTGHPAWAEGDCNRLADSFLWVVNSNPEQMLFLGRVPSLSLAILLGAVVFRWSRSLWGRSGALLSLFFYAISPNLLAHARLATNDFGATCFIYLATFALWLFIRWRGKRHFLLAGVTLGLALTAKFSALAFLPAYVLLAVMGLRTQERRSRFLRGAIAVGGIFSLAGLTIWGIYRCAWGPITGCKFSFFAPTYWNSFLDFLHHARMGHPAFLLGHYYRRGRWFYFPVVFGLKTPLPTLGMVALVCCLLVRDAYTSYPDGSIPTFFILLPPLSFMLGGMMSSINIGYRHILPVLPFLLTGIGRLGPVLNHCLAHRRWAILGVHAFLSLWALTGSLRIYPHYLAYFNELAGGPDGGWRYLVDSNLDWGQDLKGLKHYVKDQDIKHIYISWFGSTHPRASGYDLPYTLLPSFTLFPGELTAPFNPLHPAPGWYAISATNLQGVYLSDRDAFAWFRQRQPVDKIGYSIFIYYVPPESAEDAGAICYDGVSLSALDDQAQALTLARGQVALKPFNSQRAFLLPAADEVRYVFATPPRATPDLRIRFAETTVLLYDAGAYGVYRLIDRTSWDAYISKGATVPVWISGATTFSPASPADVGQLLPLPVQFEEQVALLGYEVQQDKSVLTLLTFWEVGPHPQRDDLLAIFVHLLDERGQLVSNEDRLDVPPSSWEQGDRFIQVHHLPLQGLAPGRYQLEIGLYSPATMARLSIHLEGESVADRLLLSPVDVR